MIENRHIGAVPEVEQPIPPALQEEFVTGVYSSLDRATACELARLRRENGIIPTCRSGCSHCCRYHILTNIAEAHTLVQYIRRKFSAAQISDLRMRTQQWHEWDNSRPGRPAAIITELTDLSNYVHSCPFVVDGACSVYPVRPVVCRTHFVCSPAQACRATNDPAATDAAPHVLKSVIHAASPFTMEIRDHVEKAGLDFSRSTMLLPQCLAVEMGWDFAIAP